MPSNQARSSTKRARLNPPAVSQVHTARATNDDDHGDEPQPTELIDGALKQTVEQRERIGVLVDRLASLLNSLLGTPAPSVSELAGPGPMPEGTVPQLRREIFVLACEVDGLELQLRRLDAL